MAYYTFNEDSASVLASLVEARLKNQVLPKQSQLADKIGVSQPTISKIISDLIDREKKYENCPYLEKHGNELKIASPEELLQETKKAQVLFTIREIAEQPQGYFDISKLKAKLVSGEQHANGFVYTNDYIEKSIVQFQKELNIVWLENDSGKLRLHIPLFDAERAYLEKVLYAKPAFEIIPIPSRRKRRIQKKILD